MDYFLFKSNIPEFFLCSTLLMQLLCNSRVISNNSINYPIINSEILTQGFFLIICLFLLFINQKIELISVNSLFISDFSTRYIKIIFTLILMLLFIYIWKSFCLQKINFFEYFSLLFFSVLSALLLISVNNLISAYIIIEMQALSFYLMASFLRTSSFSTEAGLKYFILGSFASAIFLLGSLFIYLTLGTFNFDNISLLLFCPLTENLYNFNYIIFLGSFLVIVTLLFKMAVAPFHFWAPDVYEGSPLASTLVFSVLPKLSFFTFLIRWVSLYINIFIYLKIIFIILGLFSIFFGAYFALIQKRLKRFIIYSSISQIGFLVIAISVYNMESYTAAYFYLLVYLFSAILLWGMFVEICYFNIKNTSAPIFLSDLSDYFKLNYLISLSFLLLFFSFSGIPPLSGFLSKVLILFSLLSEWNILISIFVILISIVASYYYLRIVKILFFDKSMYMNSVTYVTQKTNCLFIETTIISMLTYLLMFIFIYPSNLIVLSNLLAINFGLI